MQGSYGVVTINEVAVKKYNSSRLSISTDALTEIGTLHVLKNNPHFIQVYNVESEILDDRILVRVTMESGGMSLNSWLANKTIPERARVLKAIYPQIIEQLSELHNLGIIHGDISSSNILIKEIEGSFKINIIDFGFSYYRAIRELYDYHSIDEASWTEWAGTHSFVPEFYYQRRIGFASDYWRLGVCFYQLLELSPRLPSTGHQHYLIQQHLPSVRSLSGEDFFYRARQTNINDHVVIDHRSVDDDLKKIIESLLQFNPSNRGARRFNTAICRYHSYPIVTWPADVQHQVDKITRLIRSISKNRRTAVMTLELYNQYHWLSRGLTDKSDDDRHLIAITCYITVLSYLGHDVSAGYNWVPTAPSEILRLQVSILEVVNWQVIKPSRVGWVVSSMTT